MAIRISLTGLLTIILGLIVAAFVLMPFFTEVELVASAVRVAIEILLVLAVWRLSGNHRLLAVVASIVVLNEVTEWLVALAPQPGIVFLSEACTLAFIATTAGFVAWTAWRQERVGAGNLIGAIAVYFLIGYRADARWWQALEDPIVDIGHAICARIPQRCGIFWVDFTLRDVLP